MVVTLQCLNNTSALTAQHTYSIHLISTSKLKTIPKYHTSSSQRLALTLAFTVADQPTKVRPYPSAVPPGVKDVFVWSAETPAPSYFLFVVCYTNVLTYLFITEHVL